MSKLRVATLLTVVAGLLLAVPSGAPAAESCLYQSTKVTAQNQDDVEGSLLCLTNLHRVRNGLAPLPLDTRLGRAARSHSADMQARGFFDHFTPEGAGPTTRAGAFGYPEGAGENIATNTEGTALKLVEQWKASSGHNMNMLGANYQALGVGVVKGCCPGGPEGSVGTQMFGVGPANTRETGFDLYASSDKCAKAKLGQQAILKKPKKKRSPKQKRKLRRLNREIGKICKPPA
jgi:uncharacterized protein YkwD